MTDTVPAADTGLPKASLDDFDADDAGARQHRIPHDPYDAFVSALKMLLAPLPAGITAPFRQPPKRSQPT